MSQTLQADVFILARRQPADAFQTFTAFSEAHGILIVLQRVPKAGGASASPTKPSAGGPPLDLFDEASLLLESSNQGRTWFVKEARVTRRAEGIGRNYTCLQSACRLAALVARNPVEEEGRRDVTQLLRSAFDAFAAGADPSIVLFKSVYRFARDEGHPVKQQWLPSLPDPMRVTAESILATPLAEQKSAVHLRQVLPQLQRRLDDYLRGNTELQMD